MQSEQVLFVPLSSLPLSLLEVVDDVHPDSDIGAWSNADAEADACPASRTQRAFALPAPARALSEEDRDAVLKFAATFLWADLEVAADERRFFAQLARKLGVDEERATALLSRPPMPEDIDPNSLSAHTAEYVRQVALHAIAADGQVTKEEMAMFELLDDLLPRLREGAVSFGAEPVEAEAVEAEAVEAEAVEGAFEGQA